MNIELTRKQTTLLSETIRWVIRQKETDDVTPGRAVRELYELRDAILGSLVGPENVPAVTTYEGPIDLPVPHSWAEIEALIRPISVDAWVMFNALARVVPVVTGVHSFGALRGKPYERHQSEYFMRLCAGVALRIRNEFDPSAFPPPSEDDFAQAFAAVLDGLILTPIYTDEERELVEHPFTATREGKT